MTRLLALTAAAVVGIATGVAAHTGPCAPREIVVERLAEIYGESRRAIGLGGNNAVMEVFASDETGSWTITLTMVNGMTCQLASGQAFEALDEALPDEPT